MNNKELSIMTRILLWCAGVDTELLKSCQPAVLNKYKALGGLVITPALFALPSASYFLLDTLLPKMAVWSIYAAGSVGFIWSLIVLNMDRYLVISFDKSGSALKDFFSFSVLSRLVLAGVFAFVIAHPLVLAMFRGNIVETLTHQRSDERVAIISKYDAENTVLEKQIQDLLTKNAQNSSIDVLTQDSSAARDLKTQITAKQNEIDVAERELSDEIGGNVKSRTGVSGYGPTAISINNRIVTLKEQLANLNKELQQIQAAQNKTTALKQDMLASDNQNFKKIREINQQLVAKKIDAQRLLAIDKEAALNKFDSNISFDFLTMSNALDELSAKNANVYLWKWLLTALLFTIDMVALLLKVLSDKDAYDEKKQTNAYFEVNDELIKKQAYINSKADFVKHEELVISYTLKHRAFELKTSSNLNKLASLNSYIEQHYLKTNNFDLLFKKNIKPDDAFYKNFVEEYIQIANALLNDTLKHMRETSV